MAGISTFGTAKLLPPQVEYVHESNQSVIIYIAVEVLFFVRSLYSVERQRATAEKSLHAVMHAVDATQLGGWRDSLDNKTGAGWVQMGLVLRYLHICLFLILRYILNTALLFTECLLLINKREQKFQFGSHSCSTRRRSPDNASTVRSTSTGALESIDYCCRV